MQRKIGIVALAGCMALIAAACDGTFTGFGGSGGGGEVVGAFLPDDVNLEIDELPDEEGTSAKAAQSDAQITGTNAYDRTLRATGAIMHAFHRSAARAMRLAAAIRTDFTSADQTQVHGQRTVDGQVISYRADFGAFDIDGDSDLDGSGRADTEPVAIRMWVDRGNGYERFLCGVVTTRPTSAHNGAGSLYVKPDAAREASYDDLKVYFNWDRTDASHKWNEAYVAGQVRANYAMTMGHQRVDVRTDAGDVVEKTVRSTSNFTDTPFGFDTYSFSSHWRRGGSAVLISGLSAGGTSQVDFTDICVNLADRVVSNGGECDDFDTQDNDFLAAPVGDETDWPAAFTEEPSFDPSSDGWNGGITGSTGGQTSTENQTQN